ncbi:BPI fold-containing family A member 1 [Artibeus jamaicensis]|uniref:BPI fold-containing family A member 1 n=1 Tax=Artibeus jamaicensis TaxID=9417 RepID=UPI00235A8856|nr:BPI fold-containing family A member 1 [Artibeus jamaicensis]
MFQTGGLIVFCGLLALPLPVDLASSPTDIAGQLTGALSNGLLSGGLLDTIKNLPLLDILKTGNSSDGLLGRLLQQLLNPLESLTGIEITKPKLLEIDLTPSEDGHRLIVNIPLGFDVNFRVPVVNLRLLKLSVKLNVSVEVYPQKDENGIHLVLGGCSQSPADVKIALLDGTQTFLIQRLINKLVNILTNTIPKFVLGEVCSIVNGVLSQLDVTIVQSIAENLIPGKNISISV